MTTKFAPMTAEQFRSELIGQVGKPYVLGAEASPNDPNPPKFDCSELVQWAFERNGCPIGDLAAAQYDKTRALKYGESPRVGDLVFLRNNPARWNRIGHVAVITAKLNNGDWEIVEARGRKYGVVRSSLSYWKTRKYFTGVRRYEPFKLATPQPADRQFRLVWANGQAERWGGVADNSPRRGQELSTLRPSIIAGCEFSETARNATRKILGGSWVTWPEGYVWITWDKRSWECTGHTGIDYGTPYHGAISCTLQSLKPVGRGMNVIAMHVRPADSYPGKSDSYIIGQKRATINTTLKELVVDGVTTIVCGDFNIANVDDIFKTYGLVRMTPNVPTTDDGKPIDMVWATPDIITRKTTLHNPGPLSDHKWWLVQGTLTATTT